MVRYYYFSCRLCIFQLSSTSLAIVFSVCCNCPRYQFQLSCMHLSTVFYVSFNCPTCVFQLSFSSLSTVLCSSFNCLLCIKEGVLHRKSRHDQSPGSMYDQVHGTTKSSQAPLFLATAISVLVLVNHGSGIKLTSTLHKSFWSCGVEPKADNHSTLISLQLRF